jgi:hypothetical protein
MNRPPSHLRDQAGDPSADLFYTHVSDRSPPARGALLAEPSRSDIEPDSGTGHPSLAAGPELRAPRDAPEPDSP